MGAPAGRSPLAPDAFPALPAVDGVRLAGVDSGLKDDGRRDLLLAAFPHGAAAAGVFTRSRCPSAPVDWCRPRVPRADARALVVNSGNANAFTGAAGDATAAATAHAAARVTESDSDAVLQASTGVIGEPLAEDAIARRVAPAAGALSDDAWQAGAEAIGTTDTYPKGATRTAAIGDVGVTINGIAKGSGMIAPSMGTMLAFLFTDAAVPPWVLQRLVGRANGRTFNCITVDSDTSTSDTVLAFATGRAGNSPPHTASDRLIRPFARALEGVMGDLARQIVRDGEGAEKFVTITVTGATSQPAARRVGLAVANSPLVKTAIAGEDPNWGRIVMAVGKAGERAERDRLAIRIGGVRVAEAGAAVPGYDEGPVAEHMKGREIDIRIDLGLGQGRATVWTCDLTHRYIDINADYRT